MPGRHLDPADPLSTVDLTVEEIGDSAGPLAQLEHGRPAAIAWHQRRAAAGEAAVSRFLMDRVEVAAAAVAEHAREVSNALQRRQERLKRGGGREDDGSSSGSGSSSSSDSDGSRSDSDGSTGVLSRPGKDRRRRQRRAAAAAARSSLPIEGTPVRLRIGLSAWLALCTDAGLLPEHRPVRDLCLAFRAGWAVEQAAREARRTRRAAVPLLDMGGALGEKGKRRNIMASAGALGGHGRGHAKVTASHAVADDGPPVWHLYLGPVGFRHALLILACEYLYRSYGIPCDPSLTIAGTSFVGSNSGGGGASLAMAVPVEGRSGPASPGAALSPTSSVASNVSRAATALLLKTIMLAQPNLAAQERRRVTAELGRQAAADRGAAAGRASAAQLTPAARLAVFLSECVWPAAQRRLLLLGVSPTWEAHCVAIAVHAASAAAAVPASVSSAAALLIPPPRAAAAGSRGLAATIVAPAPAAAPVELPHPQQQQQQSDPPAQVLVALTEANAERRARTTAMSAISLSGRELPTELMQVLASPVLQPNGSAALQPPVDSPVLDVAQSPGLQTTSPPRSAQSAPPIARVAEADVISEQEQQQLLQPGPVVSAADITVTATSGPTADAVVASAPPGPHVAPLPLPVTQAWRNSFLVAPVDATPSLLPKGEAADASALAEPGASADQCAAATPLGAHVEVAPTSAPSCPPDSVGGASTLLRTMERWNTFWRPRSVCNAPVLGASPLSLLSDPRIVGLLLRYESHIAAVFRAHAVNATAPGFCRPETRSSSPAPQHLDTVDAVPLSRLAATAAPITATTEENVVSKANYRLGAGRYRPAPWWVNDSLPFGAPYSELMTFAATSFGEESAIAQSERAQVSAAMLPNTLTGGAKNKSAPTSPLQPPPRVGELTSSAGSTVAVALPRTDSTSAAQARTILPWAMRMQRLREQATLRFDSTDGASFELVLLRMRHTDFCRAMYESALLPSHVRGNAHGRVLLLKIFLSCASPLPDADAAAVARGVRAVHSRLMAEYKAALDDAARTIAAARNDLADVGAGPGRNSVAYRRGTSQASMLRNAMRRTSVALDDVTGVAAGSRSSSREDSTMHEGGRSDNAASDRVASSTGAPVIYASAAAVSVSLSSYAAARVRKAANDGDMSSEALRGSMTEIGLTNLSSSAADHNGDRSKARDTEHLRKLDDLAAAKGKRMRRMSEAASTVLVASHIQVAASAEAAATQSHIAGSLLRSRQRPANDADSDGSDGPDNSRLHARRRSARRASSQVAPARRVSKAAVDPSSLSPSRRRVSTDSSTVPSRRASQGETGSSPGSHAAFPRRQRRSSAAHEDVSALARALVSSTLDVSGDADRRQDDLEVILASPSSALATAIDASQSHHHASSGDDDGASQVALQPHATASGVTAISGVNDRLDLISRRLSHADQVPDIAATMSNAEFASLKFRRQLLPPTHAISVGLAPTKPLGHRESKASSASAAAIPSATRGNTTAANTQIPHASLKMGGGVAFGAPLVERDIGDPTMLSGHAALLALEPQVRVCNCDYLSSLCDDFAPLAVGCPWSRFTSITTCTLPLTRRFSFPR